MKKHSRYFAKFIFTIIAMSIYPAALTAVSLDSVRVASDAAHAIVCSAIADGDGDKLASVFASDGAVMSPGGQTIEGRLTIRITATLLLSTMGTGTLNISRHDLSIIDNKAYETGQYTLQQPLDDNKFRTYSGRYTIIWKQEDALWKIHRVIGLR